MRFHSITFKILCVLLALSATVGARTLAEYKEGITHARGDIGEMIYPEEGSTQTDESEFAELFFQELPELIPAKEKLDVKGATVETDNRWLYDKLAKYRENESSTAERQLLLNDIYERLSAVEMEIVKLETASAAEHTKDANKQKISEILNREEYLKPQPPEESLLQKTIRRIREWFNEMFPETNLPKGSTFEGLGSLAAVLKYLLYALITGAIGFLLYKFLPSLLGKYKSREKREKTGRVILGEKLAADATADSLFGDAEALANQGDLRGAIRKGYIALLCDLDERKLLRLSKNKTNRDYLRDVRKRQELYISMRGLTNNFERHWYGFDDANENDWNEFRNGYRQAVNEAK